MSKRAQQPTHCSLGDHRSTRLHVQRDVWDMSLTEPEVCELLVVSFEKDRSVTFSGNGQLHVITMLRRLPEAIDIFAVVGHFFRYSKLALGICKHQARDGLAERDLRVMGIGVHISSKLLACPLPMVDNNGLERRRIGVMVLVDE